jgi:excisionase family DNA binding protein
MGLDERKLDLVKDGTVSVNEAAEFTGLSRSKLYELMEAGNLAYVNVRQETKKRGRRLIPRRALQELLQDSLVMPA